MSLTQVTLPEDGALAAEALPDAVEALVREGERRIEAFERSCGDTPVYAFIPSDFRVVYRGLAWITRRGLAPGRTFCEWGSGYGVVALLAASLGWEATGIEVEPALVEAAAALATDTGLSAEFVAGSFVPQDGDVRPDAGAELAWLDDSAEPAYAELGLDADDFDLTFAYPWPGESEVILDLFEEHAARGALLLTFNGTEGLRLFRRA